MTKEKKNQYFTKFHEEAIVKYSLSQNLRERNIIYRDCIMKVFDEMIDKIVYTYKFNTLPNIECLKDECRVDLVTILEKYDPSKGKKAFSYFSIVTKNWFIQKTKKNKSKLLREVEHDNVYKLDIVEEGVPHDMYQSVREEYEFFHLLLGEIGKWKEMKLRDNERKVLNAIEILFIGIDDVEIFNKKAIYLYLRELTGMNTKQVVSNLKRIRERYKGFKRRWDEGDDMQ